MRVLAVALMIHTGKKKSFIISELSAN